VPNRSGKGEDSIRRGELGDQAFDDLGFEGNKKKPTADGSVGFLAGATGFEPAVSALTGPRVNQLHHAPGCGPDLYHSGGRASTALIVCAPG
jgi:hypothetical protein